MEEKLDIVKYIYMYRYVPCYSFFFLVIVYDEPDAARGSQRQLYNTPPPWQSSQALQDPVRSSTHNPTHLNQQNTELIIHPINNNSNTQ